MAESPSAVSVNKAEVQKIYDAQKGDTREAAAKKDPFVALNPETGNFFFKNEYERKMFLAGLEAPQVAAAIDAVQRDKVGLSPTEKEDYLEVLKALQKNYETIQRTARSDLRKEILVIDATIPGPKWEKAGKEVTVERKKYGVEKREGSEKGKSDLKIDAGLAASVLVKDVPDKDIDTVLKAYEAANAKNAKESPLKSGMFGKTVKYGEIKGIIEPTPVAATMQVVDSKVEVVKGTELTLDDNQDILKDGKPFTGKIDKNSPIRFSNGDVYSGGVVNGKLEGKGDIVYKDGDKYTGEFKNNKHEGKGKYYNNNPTDGNPLLKYVFDGTYLAGKRVGQGTQTWGNGEVWEGKWKDDKFHDGTKKNEAKNILSTWKDGKEVIVETSIVNILTEVNTPKGFTLSYDEEKKQVQLKNGDKIVGYFTPENEENKDRRTPPQIQKWVDTKVKKIRDSAGLAKQAELAEPAAEPAKVIKLTRSVEGIQKHIRPADDSGLTVIVKDGGSNDRYELDISYKSKSSSLWEYSMIPTQQIIVSSDNIENGKTWKNIDFRAYLGGSSDRYIPGFGQTFDIVLGKDGTIKLEESK